MIKVKRAYEKHTPGDGMRFLVDRLWPRGVKASELRIDAWLKDAGPSTKLRQWFSHDATRWDEFCVRYFAELDDAPDAWEPIVQAARRRTVTLVYGSRDVEHNNAVALKRYIEEKLRG
jgi:uncharacterized protein YeaO (DUF488 family)